MAGMYPDNQTLELFGESVSYPGVDEDGKFTNGSFSDPAEKPSFIPAETINLVLDNLSELIVSLGKTPNNQDADQLALAVEDALALKANNESPIFSGTPTAPEITNIPNIMSAWGNQLVTMNTLRQVIRGSIYPVGKIYTQLPSEPTPVEAGLLGTWEVWNNRVELYGLSTLLPNVASIPSYNPDATAAIAINEYRIVTHADGDKAIYQLKEAHPSNEVLGPFDPVKWRSLSEVSTNDYRPIFVSRKDVQPSWLDDDLEIGTSVTYNGATYLISARHNLGGKFLSGAGGNRPPFITGGVAGEERHTLTVEEMPSHTHSANTVSPGGAGFAGSSSAIWNPYGSIGSTGGDKPHNNIPPTLTVRYWRRVA